MLVLYFHAPPPTDEKDKRVARLIAWIALGLGALITMLSVVLPPQVP